MRILINSLVFWNGYTEFQDMSESSKKEGYHTSGETEEEGERTDGCQEGESRSSSFYFRRSSTSCSDDISKGTDLTGNQKQDSDNNNTEVLIIFLFQYLYLIK